VCHGEKGAGKPNDTLVGGRGTLTGDQAPVKTVGSFWPYVATIFDYVRRAMPLNEPMSLSNVEVYALVAYLLQLNGVTSLPRLFGTRKTLRRATALGSKCLQPIAEQESLDLPSCRKMQTPLDFAETHPPAGVLSCCSPSISRGSQQSPFPVA
jgi:hypothetical protein